MNSSWVMGRRPSIRRRAWAIAVPSGRPTGKTSVRIGGSDSTSVTAGNCEGRSSDTSSTSMTRKVAYWGGARGPGLRRRARPASRLGVRLDLRLHVGHLNFRRAPTLRARPTALKNTSTAVPP